MSYAAPPPPNPYEQGGYGAPPPTGPYAQQRLPVAAYAHWGKRVVATLVDGGIGMVLAIPYYVGYGQAFSKAINDSNLSGSSTTAPTIQLGAGSLLLMAIGLLLSLAFFVWNTCFKQGRTGYSIGKGLMGIRLISEKTGQPIGAGMSFVRQIVHIVDSLPCDLGYLWPLWDQKRQTFADKILSTIVIDQPKG